MNRENKTNKTMRSAPSKPKLFVESTPGSFFRFAARGCCVYASFNWLLATHLGLAFLIANRTVFA